MEYMYSSPNLAFLDASKIDEISNNTNTKSNIMPTIINTAPMEIIKYKVMES